MWWAYEILFGCRSLQVGNIPIKRGNNLIIRSIIQSNIPKIRSSHLEVFLRTGVLKICSTFTGEHPCRSAISIKLHSNFIKIVLRHGCFPVDLLYIFRTPFLKNTSGQLLMNLSFFVFVFTTLKKKIFKSGQKNSKLTV